MEPMVYTTKLQVNKFQILCILSHGKIDRKGYLSMHIFKSPSFMRFIISYIQNFFNLTKIAGSLGLGSQRHFSLRGKFVYV